MYVFSQRDFNEISQKQRLSLSIVVFLSLSFLLLIINYFRNILVGDGYDIPLFFYFLTLVLGIVFILFSALMMHLLFLAFKGKGNFLKTLEGLLSVLNIIFIVSLFLFIFMLFAMSVSSLYSILGVVFGFVMFALAIYSLVVMIKLFTHIHKISMGKCIGVVLITYSIVIVLFFIFLAGSIYFITSSYPARL